MGNNPERTDVPPGENARRISVRWVTKLHRVNVVNVQQFDAVECTSRSTVDSDKVPYAGTSRPLLRSRQNHGSMRAFFICGNELRQNRQKCPCLEIGRRRLSLRSDEPVVASDTAVERMRRNDALVPHAKCDFCGLTGAGV